jgi:hypothetical protein
VNSDELRDLPAHRRTGEMGCVDVEGVHETDRILRHFIERVRELRGLRTGREPRPHGGPIGRAGCVEVRREANVAIVEDDDAISGSRERVQ